MILWIPDHFVLVIRKQFSNRVKHVLCSSCLEGFCCCFNKESHLKCQISSLWFLIQGRTPGLLSGSCCTHSWNSQILPWTLGGGDKSQGLDKAFQLMPVTILTFLFSSVLACDMAGGMYFVSFTDQANECTLLTVWQAWQVCRDGAAAGGTWRFNLGNSSPVFLLCLTRVCQVMSGMQMYFGS